MEEYPSVIQLRKMWVPLDAPVMAFRAEHSSYRIDWTLKTGCGSVSPASGPELRSFF